MEEQQKMTGSPLNFVMIQKNLNSDLKTHGSGDDGCRKHLGKFFWMRNDVNASNEDSRREIILNVRIKCLLQVTILELVKIEMNDILDVMFFTKIVLQEHFEIKGTAPYWR